MPITASQFMNFYNILADECQKVTAWCTHDHRTYSDPSIQPKTGLLGANGVDKYSRDLQSMSLGNTI